MDGQTRVIRQSRLKLALILLVCLAFVALGWWLVENPGGSRRASAEVVDLVGWACVVLGAFGTVHGSIRCVRPGALRLSPDGLLIEHWPQRRFATWSEIRAFSIVDRKGTKSVCWELHTPPRDDFSGVFNERGSIGKGWEYPPESVRSILRDWKAHYAPEP